MHTAAMFTQEKITKASKVCWQKSHWQVLHRQIRNGKLSRAKLLVGFGNVGNRQTHEMDVTDATDATLNETTRDDPTT